MTEGYYYCLNCHSEITPDYNEHCCFCGTTAIAVSGDYSNEEVERAFDLLNKEQQGLLIVPPCKVGDTVCIPSKTANKVFTKLVEEILIRNDDEFIYCANCYFPFENIGKSVFLTREEAEKALRERKENV